MSQDSTLLKGIMEHTWRECNELVSIYDEISYDEPIKNRLKQQIYMEKIKQSDLLYQLYQKEYGEELVNREEKKGGQPNIGSLIIEEVEYINNLQIIYNQIDNSKSQKVMINLMFIQQQIIFKLFSIQAIA
ncbi:hypothetical protein [Vallitalea okinawensis]|uniref:hypothetical protein n=1 Tax=Vallitalea okinawensis TaxID=2078660 RepID=UPI000CFBAABA|nr:hypothetical protein [Vallitalea okinawensis]